MRPTGSAGEIAVRRRIAGELLLEGKGIREVARIVQASTSSVKRWKDMLDEFGSEGLDPNPHAGRTPFLTARQKQQLVTLLEEGPLASGFHTNQWTCPRVAHVIERQFGVTYHPGHVRRILHELGWTYQKPEQRARERDERAIRRWRKREWPRIKRGLRRQASVVFLDESGFMLQPFRGGTWAPSGQTPVEHAWDRRDRLSAMVALSLSPFRHHIGLYHHLQRGNIHGPDAVVFLRDMHHHLQREIILVIDRYSVHRAAVRSLREAQTPWLRVEWLPPYAPDLDPVEAVWNHTKCVDLANFVPDDLDELRDAVIDSLEKQATSPSLKRSFFDFAGLRV